MAQEVNKEYQDESAGVRAALTERIGPERLDLWIPEGTHWNLDGTTLTLTFNADFSAQLAQKMLGKDLSSALATLVGESADVRMESSSEVAAPRKQDSSRPAASEDGNLTVGTSRTDGEAIESTKRGQQAKLRAAADTIGKTEVSQLRSHSQTIGSTSNDSDLWSRFLPSPSNQIGWATAKLIVTQPGDISPVFLHGPSGVGKSMLVSAIAQKLRVDRRLPRVVHLTSEQFLNDFTDGLRGGGLPMFRRKYRDVEVLILEDIHFFLGKKSSITEVKHTIDNLLRLKKQVVCTADRSLNDLQGLGNELVGRLRGGLTTPLFPLDEDVRLALLRRDLEEKQIEMDESVLKELALRLTGDGRVLSGVVKRLIAFTAMQPEKLNWDRCWSAVGDLIQATQPIVRITDIDRVVCDMFGLEPESLQSSSKIRRVSQPRMLAMFLARKYTPSAYKEIGHYFGKRRHSTVISAEKTVENWLEENADFDLGRGLSVRQAIHHVESQLQVG